MENEIIEYREVPLTAAQVKAQVQRIQEIMAAVMKEGHHYGVIPGTPKPTLYKPGSEKLLSTFHIGVDPSGDSVTDLSTVDEVRYRVAARGFSQATGALLGVGIGECSSNEEKYKWRKPVCDQEFEETPEDRKRISWKKGERGPYQQKQIRTNPADVANTILKMAKKRAQIDMTLTVTSASDIFDQDLEDLPEGLRENATEQKTQIKEPQSKSGQRQTQEEQTVSIMVAEIASKTGTTNGKSWTRYGIKDENGIFYNTFSDTFAIKAQEAKDNGVPVKIGFITNPKGSNDIKSLTLDIPFGEETA